MRFATILIVAFSSSLSAQDIVQDTAVQDTVVRSGDQLVIPSIDFEIDDAQIRQRSYPALDEIAQWLRDHPETRVEIQAHTDPTWVCEYCGRRLTHDRARSVRAALIHRGIPAERLEARGYRGERPLAACDQRRRRARRSCQARNRRIEIHLL